MDTKKYLIPSDISMSQLVWIIYERDGYLAIARPLASHGAGGGGGGASRRRRALLVIAGVWACSAAISFAPIYAGWSTPLPARTLHEAAAISVWPCYAGWFADRASITLYSDVPADCGLHVNRVYAVVSSATSFYLPLVVMATVPGIIRVGWHGNSSVIAHCHDNHLTGLVRRRLT